MKLFEIHNGYTGESFVRSYVWANDRAEALTMFVDAFPEHKAYHVFELLDGDDKPFVTELDDCGFGERRTEA